MKKSIVLSGVGILLALSMGSKLAWAATDGEKKTKTIVVEIEEKRFPPRSIPATERPNSLIFEILGRAGDYSIQYDRALSNLWSVGGGLSVRSVAGLATFMSFPLYANYYFSPENDRFYATGGLTVSTASGAGAAISGLTLNAGAGYELRAEKGFLFRAAPYLNFGSTVSLWFGISLGYSFQTL